ncbi:amidohydrolase family protein [Jiangella anatolica]|uniref:D-glutamate deacylase n=1 Tax=Jiangella anatolica TaxID=2670374 RepID=A0A2W2C1Z1_9ACTN|nr:amidohydrolase family protein [Jiangella anatolica]PZF86744.1 D-glutamate deacylase [Jiangella anatolica]
MTYLPDGGLLVRGGRVVDPHNDVDRLADLYLSGGTVAAVLVPGTPVPARHDVVDAAGCVVAPGFVDLHSHAMDLESARLQALDGVTTALELESGAVGVDAVYRRVDDEGRPINYGFSACWALARMAVLDGRDGPGHFDDFALAQQLPHWRRPAGAGDRARIVAALEAELDAGALGLGILLGYAPATAPEEYLALGATAAAAGVPTFTHARHMTAGPDDNAVGAVEEVVRVAGTTGAHMHLCHLNSTSGRLIDKTAELISSARDQRLPVSTEAYPYGGGSTIVGAPFLAPERLASLGIEVGDIQLAESGEPIASEDALRTLRADSPGALIVFHFLRETSAADRRLLFRALTLPDVVIASDAMPLRHSGRPGSPGRAHPRGVGSFAKVFRLLVRETGTWSLTEAVRRCTTLPAALLAASVPAMARKGHLSPGADADVVVLDPDTVTDRATYAEALPSAGIRHVIVNGTPVVAGGELLPDAAPGRAVRR